MRTALQQLHREQQQSPWLDTMSRPLIEGGALQQLIDEGIRGATVNPAIFEKTVLGTSAYDQEVETLATSGAAPGQIYEELLIDDVGRAADMFRPLYDQSGGEDGYVSIEVHPGLARNTAGTVAEAQRFASRISRPNIFVKVPATSEGIPAIRQLTAAGINVNITLIFSIQVYEQVMEAYLTGLEDRVASGQPLHAVRSVASFFVSRIDTEVDRQLGAMSEIESNSSRHAELQGLQGTAAIANAKVAYQRFREMFGSNRFIQLQAHGAQLQRPLWASTGTKNPAYRDVRYVEELIGPDSVTTIPLETVAAFQDHGRVERTINHDDEQAQHTLEQIQAMGIDLEAVTDKLLHDGLVLFSEALVRLNDAIVVKSGTVPVRHA